MKVKILVRSMGRGLLFSMLIFPLLLPLFLMVLTRDAKKVNDGDWPVTVVQDALETEYSRFHPRKIFQIGMYIDDIADLQVTEKIFASRFVYWGRNFFDKSANDRSLVPEDEFRLVNHADLEIEPRAVRFIGPGDEKENPFLAYTAYEADGELKNGFYLASYPFDVHTLRWTIEPRHLTAEEMILSIDPSSSLSEGLDLGEWDILGFSAHSEIHTAKSDYSDPELAQRGALWQFVPRAVFEVTVRRQILSHLIKELLPLLVILMIAYSNFFVDPSYFDARSSVAVTCVLTVVALHWTSSSELPGISYLTAMDQFFLVGYSLVLLASLETVISLVASPEGKGRADHPWLVYGLPALKIGYPLLVVFSWYWITLRAMHSF